MRIHLIAIGGAVMHNLAMALHNKGFRVTGSDDEVFEPSRSRLAAYGLLPETTGWNPARITPELDGVILGMHAKKDNPELLRAQELNIKIWSFPEYIYEQSKDKKRVVIGGSHGKTTVTSMIMHVLHYNHFDFDYMVGSQLEGFETMVKLTSDAPVIILEGDEYLSSPIDPRPKFLLYHPHIAVLTGIAWDHMNVFPTFENYLEQFRVFAEEIREDGVLFWYEEDRHLQEMTGRLKCRTLPYAAHPYTHADGKNHLAGPGLQVEVPVFGNHNMQNIQAALEVCRELGLPDAQFYEAISSFRGAARRQELLTESDQVKVFLDFAHAPSKVKATLNSFREQWPEKRIFAFLEIHTFSSLNRDFLPQYRESLGKADAAYVFYDPHVVEIKNLPPLDRKFVGDCFGTSNIKVLDEKGQLEAAALQYGEGIYLFMSSGSFSGMDLKALAAEIAEENHT
jgi:UDP-N-acetylmuramate: L-alanyl-gamma-D-glutamyl-meso-diaminopimelate ligase